LPIGVCFAISRAFAARLIKGCRGGVPSDLCNNRNIRYFNALASIKPAGAPSGALPLAGSQESQMPKLKTKSGAKKRFKITASGKVKYAQRGKRHGMIKRTKKQIRQLRGTNVLFKTDGDNIKKYWLPNG
jgi:large subunit ribosomal protein L35